MSQEAYKTLFASDIFNTEQQPPLTERAHKVKHRQERSEVLDENKSKPEKTIKTHRSLGPKSDIFFRNAIDEKKPNRDKRNVSHKSSVFAHLNSKDYVVHKQRDGKIYDPSYYYKEETPIKRRLKELYSDDELSLSVGSIGNRTSTSKGFLQKENESYQPPMQKLIRHKANTRKLLWRMATSNDNSQLHYDYNDNSTTHIIRMNYMKSNIFNDPQKEQENQMNTTVGRGITYREKEPTPFMSPISVRRSKWCNKFDWKSPQNEILYKTPNDKEEEKRNAFQRKCNELYGSVPDLRQLPKEKDIVKEDIESYLPVEYQKCDKARKVKDNVSATGFEENFYKKNMKNTANPTIDHEYQIKGGNGIDEKDIKRIFDNKGIHVYNIQDDSSMIFNKTAFKFNIRENDKESFDKAFSEVCDRFKKEKGIEIEPVKKITVNKLKPQDFSLSNDKKMSMNDKDNNNKTLKKHKSELPKEFRQKFSKEFYNVSNTYKNDCLRKYQNHIVVKPIN